MKSKSGFTIVELLIVIVVIAILAAISIVAYSGIQQRANNTAIIDAANKSYRLIQAYIAENGSYPITSGSACITTASGCVSGGTSVSGSSTFDTNIATIGAIPRSIPDKDTTERGVYLTYASTTWNGDPQPLRMTYMLSGTNQACKVDRVSQYVYPGYIPSTTGYTSGNSNGRTRCWISIPGPSS